jgi:hypothetical protein
MSLAGPRESGDTLNKKLSDPNGYISLLLKLGMSDSRILEHMTLSAFSRYPSEQERTEWPALLAKARPATGSPEQQLTARKQALEDMLWVMLTSKEFMFNH